MSRDFKLKACLILGTLATGTALIVALDLYFPPQDAVRPILVTGLLAAVAVFYHRFRKVPQFVWTSTAMAQLLLFSSCYTVLMYSIACTARPLVDDSLVQADQWFGFEVPQMVAWADAHPNVRICLQRAYNTLLPQTALIVVILGFLGDRRQLETFMLRFMFATLLTAVFFFAYPAEGPFSAYEYPPNQSQARYLEHFQALRSGESDVVTWRGAEGLITFPSFHTTWAILLALALRHRPIIFAFSAVLNAAVIAATLGTGWHYVSDVVGGALVGVIVIALVHCLAVWLYPRPAEEPAQDHAVEAVGSPVLSQSARS
ncbi:MAG: phosphatase PAP2 family protein [Planctomycetota bacterium]|jgi:membrane-associated phospholipid phosphatase